MWCVYELLFVKRRSPRRVGALLGALAGAQALIEPELLTMLGVVFALGFMGMALSAPGRWRSRLDHLLQAAPPAIVVFLLVAGYMIWSILFAPGHLVGTIQPVWSLQIYRADLLGPIIPTINQLILPSAFVATAAHYIAGNFSENSSYLGLPAVVLVLAFGARWRRDSLVLTSALLALIAFILSLGSRLTINGHVTSIPLPEALFARIPLLDNTVPVRFSSVVALFSMIVLVVGGDRFVASMSRRGNTNRAGLVINGIGTATLAACVLFLLPQVPFTTKEPPWPSNTVAILSVIPRGSAVLAYPFPTPEFTEAMSWQAEDHMRYRIFGGYAIVQGGTNYGSPRAPLLSLPFVQEYFTNAQYGASRLYPPPDPKISARGALCRFIVRYKVGAVVYWKAGVHPRKVLRLFDEALGPPSRSTPDGTVDLWLTRPNGCIS